MAKLHCTSNANEIRVTKVEGDAVIGFDIVLSDNRDESRGGYDFLKKWFTKVAWSTGFITLEANKVLFTFGDKKNTVEISENTVVTVKGVTKTPFVSVETSILENEEIFKLTGDDIEAIISCIMNAES